jgi:hypothetical protein
MPALTPTPTAGSLPRYPAALKLLPAQVQYEARAYSGVRRLAARLQSMQGDGGPVSR